MLEKTIEKKVCEYAKTKNIIVEKFGQKGNPDRIFICPDGSCFFIEFKQKGKHLSLKQCFKIKKLLENKAKVFVVDSLKYGIDIINLMVL